MIKLEFDKSALYQWDLNMRIELENIPAGIEVHYSDNQNTQNECPVLLSYEEDEKVYANIPNAYLQRPGIIYVYIYVKENNKGYTKHYSEIFVLPRKKPSDYVYTETEVKSYETLEKRISTLEKGGVSDEKIESVIKGYLEENPIEAGATKEQAEQIEKNKQDIGKISNKMNDKLDSSKLPEAINTALAQAKASGEFKGDTPQKGTDYFTEADKQAFVTDVINALPTWQGGSY